MPPFMSKHPTGAPARPDASGFFLAALGAVGFVFGMPNAFCHIPWLVLFFPFVLYVHALRALSGKQAFACGCFSGLLGALGSLYWVVFPMRDVAGMPFPLALPAVALLAAYLSCYAGFACLGMYRLHRHAQHSAANGPGRASAVIPPLLAGFVYAGFEALCGFLFTGFPWLTLATAFAFTPAWVQGTSLIGGYALGGLYASGACLAAAALYARGTARVACLALGLLLVAAPPLYGLYRLAQSPPLPEQAKSLHVVMAQGNVDQNEKWVAAYQEGTLSLYLDLSEEAVGQLPDEARNASSLLVLWPETAMPFYYELHDNYAARLKSFARKNKAHLAFGTLGVRDVSGNPGLFNRMYLLSPEGEVNGQYDKEHLVPFGEYIPFSASIPYLDKILQYMNFSSGSYNRALPMQGAPGQITPMLGTLICYEAIFPSLAQKRVSEGANVLVNISNDGWFRKSSAPLQHFSHAILRSVEQARPLVRGTNTGITAVVDSRGRISARLSGLFVEGALAGSVAPSQETTLYHRLHPAPEIALAALALFALFGYSFFGRRRSL